jgi:hypothetical protein
MKTPIFQKYSLVQKFKCGVCTTTHCYGNTQEFFNEDDMKKHMKKHCQHVNVVVRHLNHGLDMVCADCSCTFGMEYVIKEKQTKFEVKNPDDLMKYVEVIENLNTQQDASLKLMKHILFLQKSWGFYKTKKKIRKMTKKELIGVN